MDLPNQVTQEWMAPAGTRNGYYVSAILEHRRALVLGPFATHEQALAQVEPERSKWTANAHAQFAAWGTCRVGPHSSEPTARIRRPKRR